MGKVEAPVGSVAIALDHASRLLVARPELAQRQAEEILSAVPGHPVALAILGAARRRQDDPRGALAVLEPLARTQPGAANVHHELGLTLATLGHGSGAIAALRRAVAVKPDMPEAWRALGDQLTLAGDAEGADRAYARHIQASVNDPRLMEAALALGEDRMVVAERLLREHIELFPTDVAAMRMLAEAHTRLGRYLEAEDLLVRCLELSPSFTGARHNYAVVLFRQQKGPEAVAEVERLLEDDPRDPGYRALLAGSLGLIGEYDRSAELYRGLLADSPSHPRIWLSLGHSLRTAGHRDEAVAAYRRSIELAPSLGDAYWSLANFKTVPFTDEEIAAIRMQLARADISPEDRFHLHYALGKAQEDTGEFGPSFENYAQGARLRRDELAYDAAETTAKMSRAKALFSKDFLGARAGWGDPSPEPIFIVGLPRSGSTLVEQILASHSAVEGTMELPEIGAFAREFERATQTGRAEPYPERLAAERAGEIAAYGRTYLERSRVYRKVGRARFIDKMPNNFQHLGFIRLILPNARIIDARRHPMAACFSAFKQHFARGQAFSYDLSDLGRYYRDYIEFMAHFDEVAPGMVHRVIHEDLVDDTEGEVRRMLDYLGLPFEPACLEFYRTERAVRTASSEQVRRPIFREGLDHWRNYEPWLDPLAEALGPALTDWRGDK